MEKRAKTQDELSMLNNQAFADLLLDYQQGAETPLYAVASMIFSGSDPDLKQVGFAVNELKTISSKLSDYRKTEAGNLAIELSNRYPEQNKMEEKELSAWVSKNCKFAQVQQPAPAMPQAPQAMPQQAPMPQKQKALLNPKQLQPIYQQIANSMKGSVQQDPDPAANYNAVKKQVTMALNNALNQSGGAVQNVAQSVDDIMQMLGVLPPAPVKPQQQQKPLGMQRQQPMQQGPNGEWQDPGFAAFRKTRQGPQQ